jgi:hypothetical protein
MSTRIVERGDRAYEVEGDGPDMRVVRVASTAAELLPETEDKPAEIALGDRVEADGKLGVVTASADTIYGPTLTVHYDDGESESFFPEDIKISDTEAPEPATPIDGLLAEAAEYEAMPDDTLEQVTEKLARGRELNLRAKALASASELDLSLRAKLDQIVTSTTVDQEDLKEAHENLALAENTDYFEERRANKDVEVLQGSSFSPEDASWLGLAADEAEADAAEVDWELNLTATADTMTGQMTEEVANDDELVAAQIESAIDQLGIDESLRESFTEKVQVARVNRIADLESAEKTAKEASAAAEAEIEDDPDYLF